MTPSREPEDEVSHCHYSCQGQKDYEYRQQEERPHAPLSWSLKDLRRTAVQTAFESVGQVDQGQADRQVDERRSDRKGALWIDFSMLRKAAMNYSGLTARIRGQAPLEPPLSLRALEVPDHHLRGVETRDAHDPAAGVGARSTEVEAVHGRPVSSELLCGAEREKLI